MSWTVRVNKKAAKRAKTMPKNTQSIFDALVRDLMITGPVQTEWPNYSKLPGGRHHCHLTYSFVVVWEVVENELRILEVLYVGSREDAPY